MKLPILPLLLAAATIPLLTSCNAPAPKQPTQSAAVRGGSDGKSVKAAEGDLNEYRAVSVADPLEPINRATFWINDGLYTVVLRPLTKGYEFVIPKPVRTGIHNVFENVRFPVRFVNDTLQGNFKRAGLETGKFFVNSIAGVGGIGERSVDIGIGHRGEGRCLRHHGGAQSRTGREEGNAPRRSLEPKVEESLIDFDELDGTRLSRRSPERIEGD